MLGILDLTSPLHTAGMFGKWFQTVKKNNFFSVIMAMSLQGAEHVTVSLVLRISLSKKL